MAARRLVLIGVVVALVGASSVVGPAQASVTAVERRCGNTTSRVQLTFDDAADPTRVHALLDVLADKQVRAGFFLLGQWAARHPSVMARIRNDGHWLGNHTATHADLARLPDGAIRRELDGGVAGELLRPPYGSVNSRVRAVAASAGYRLCLWDIDTWDWRGRGPDEIRRTVFDGLRPGAVVLLHLHARHTLAALPSLIDGIRERGYELDPLARFAGAAIDPTTSAPMLVGRDGAVLGGSSGHDRLSPPVVPEGDAVAIAPRPDGHPGHWVATSAGSVHAVGGAPFHGAQSRLNAPVVALASTPSGDGYWMTATDGGVFSHGDAGFFGSTGALRLNEPIVAMAAHPGGRGYWLLARDGGVFTFGESGFFGSAAEDGARSYVAIAARPQGDGYWLLRRDGGVAAFGGAAQVEALHGTPPGAGPTAAGYLAIAATSDGAGYRLVTDRPGEAYLVR